MRVPLRGMPWLSCLLFTALMIPTTLLASQHLQLQLKYALALLVAVTLLYGFVTRLLDIRALRETITRKS